MTEFYEGQGLGNQLWAYCACRSIAEQIGVNYSVINPQNFKGNKFLDIEFGETKPILDDFDEFREAMYFDSELDCYSSIFDERVLRISKDTKIDGLFQSEDYFFGDLERLKKYIKLKPDFLDLQLIDKDTCVLYIRGGEYKRHRNLILPKSYWDNAIMNMQTLFGINNFVAVSDDDRYVKSIYPNMKILDISMEQDYAALYQARYAILANSSWGYFPVKTGCTKIAVIAPLHWARFGNKFNRWSMPANLYKDWLWQDVKGVLSDYDKCYQSVIQNKIYYENNFNIRTTASALSRQSFRSILPKATRVFVKKILAKLFPKHIG